VGRASATAPSTQTTAPQSVRRTIARRIGAILSGPAPTLRRRSHGSCHTYPQGPCPHGGRSRPR
jgi:hypothetical protein